MKRYIITSNRLKDAEKVYIKEQMFADIHWNERVALEMNADNTLKQLSNDWMKTPATENEWNKLVSSHPQIESKDYMDNKFKNLPNKTNRNQKMFCLGFFFFLVWFYGMSTIVGYLMLNPIYTYTLNIYDLFLVGFYGMSTIVGYLMLNPLYTYILNI